MEEPLAILTTQSVREYFRDLLLAAEQSQHVRVAESTEFYLVNLLSEFLSAEMLYPRDAQGARDAEPLAFILKRAQESNGQERLRELKKLGDVSLYTSGFFGDSLSRKLVDTDYYIAMGGRAYGILSSLHRDATLGELYQELANKFVRFVDLLAEVADRSAVGTNKGIIKLYERFMRTGSERVGRVLSERGVLPMRDPGTVQ
jgi:hypothetical protein